MEAVKESVVEKANYGNWVATKLVMAPALLGLVFAGLAWLIPALGLLALVLFLCSGYFAYARYLFSPGGGNVQARVMGQVLDYIPDWKETGRVLDIGCGNGPLTIRLAKEHSRAEIVGIDYWGQAWEFSKKICDQNAQIEGVADRTTFERASAAELPFADESFDGVVSNMVFHEVGGVKDKKELIKEALRVLKKGGWFVFQDLFLWKRVYGDIDEVLGTIKAWGVEDVQFVDTSKSDFIPGSLKLPFMLGTAGILYGRK